jgi:sigma-B regulation protein RsbU (phosphoserine phosphatase)
MDLKSLQKKLDALIFEKKAYQAQNRLFENLIDLARSCAESEMLKISMQKTLDLASDLSGADKATLLLLNEEGVVTDSILTRERDQINSQTREDLIGRVLNKGLAGWVKQHLKVGVVDDSEKDERWLDLPEQPYTVRSALAVPILRHKSLFGILTLMHSEPGRFQKEAINIVQATADQMALAIENAKLYMALANAKGEIEAYSRALNLELEKGRKIQRDFLPKSIPIIKNLEISAEFRPALQVSGDFYDVFMLPHDLVGILIGDVSDKGVGAGLFMALIRSFIRVFSERLITHKAKPKHKYAPRTSSAAPERIFALEAVEITNDYLACEHGGEGMFATLFFGVLDPASGLIQYINAGHEPVYVFGDNVKSRCLGPTGPAVGVIGNIEYDRRDLRLEPGAIIFGYTDGVTEACSPSGEMFTRLRLEKLISESHRSSAKDFISKVQSSLFSFIGNAPAHDDVTMLAVQRKF